ncbi:Uncharacterised protein [Yersinia frederiksenii]|nr:Uncharacterised protein [Yersinia frederiksenii]
MIKREEVLSLTLPLMYFQTGADLSKITHHEVNYQEGFVQQAWLRPEMQLFVVCVARKKGSLREIKGGMAVLTSILASNGTELANALDDVMRQSDALRSLAGKDKNVFIPAKIGISGDAPPTEEELLSVFYQQCLKHGSWGNA